MEYFRAVIMLAAYAFTVANSVKWLLQIIMQPKNLTPIQMVNTLISSALRSLLLTLPERLSVIFREVFDVILPVLLFLRVTVELAAVFRA